MATNDAKYQRDHKRVREKRGKARDELCVNFQECDRDALDWAHIHGTDETDPDNYQPMCRKCHKDYDRPKWLTEERKKDQARKENTSAFKGWTPERREAQRQRMMDKWSDPKERSAQADRASRDKPWLGRRPSKDGGLG